MLMPVNSNDFIPDFKHRPTITQVPSASSVAKTKVLVPKTVILKNTERDQYGYRLDQFKGTARGSDQSYVVPDIRVSNKPLFSTPFKLNIAGNRRVGKAYDHEAWAPYTTIKEQTEDNIYAREIGAQKHVKNNRRYLYDNARTTIKEQVMYEHHGYTGARPQQQHFRTREDYYNAEINGLKEATLIGRAPVAQGSKVGDAKWKWNIESNNIQYNTQPFQRRVHRKANLHTGENLGDFTRQGQYYDDARYNLDRIDPSLLNPFRNNPLTQPLDSAPSRSGIKTTAGTGYNYPKYM